MVSYHFLNGTTKDNFFTNDSAHGAGILWSNIPNVPAFAQQTIPFPIIIADSRPVGSNLTTTLSNTATVYEVSSSPLICIMEHIHTNRLLDNAL